MDKTAKNKNAPKSATAKRYDEDFKKGAISLVVDGKRPAAQVARDLGVTAETLRSWVKNATSPPDSQYMQLKAAQAELKRLRKELLDKEDTIVILKKAAAIFTKT